ncbi:hypothetical protein OMCYN_01769 [cyanobiont of Ornithocercus magnificus]|nr:hypothetical protein OMCYN_01769 [cyanobiont of Ornithocercus magnificus]
MTCRLAILKSHKLEKWPAEDDVCIKRELEQIDARQKRRSNASLSVLEQ